MKTTTKQKNLLTIIKNYKIGQESKEKAIKAAFELMLDAEEILIKFYNMQVEPEEIKDIIRNEFVKILENDFKDFNEKKADFINWFVMRVNHRIINFTNSKRNKIESLSETIRDVSYKTYISEDFSFGKRIYGEIYKTLTEPIEQFVFTEFFLKETKIRELSKKTNTKVNLLKQIIENIREKLKNNNKILQYYENITGKR